jgi:hypothetical protein
MASQVGRNHAPAIADQRRSRPIPAAGMIARSVKQDDEWGIGLAPFDVAELEPL